MRRIVPGLTPVWSEEMAKVSALMLSDTDKSVLRQPQALFLH
jgi:hypothetical protein